MYTFQKVRLNHNAIIINYDWMLVIDNMEDLIYYHKRMLNSKLSHVWDNLIKTKHGKSHIDNTLSLIIYYQNEATEPKSIFELTAIASEKIFSAKAIALQNTGKIYINKNGGFFPHSKDITILEEIKIDNKNLIFPQYTEKDIKVKQWPDGKHWYAYVGDFQVEYDEEKKWNSKERAYKCAKYFLYQIQNEQFKIKE